MSGARAAVPSKQTATPDGDASRLRIAYTMSRFPKLTETFVLFEIAALEAEGHTVEVYPLLRETPGVMHAEAERYVRRAHYLPFLSFPIVRSQIRHLRRHPRRYARTLLDMIRGTWGSLNFLIGGLAIFPKVAHIALLLQEQGIRHVHCHFANHPALAGFIIRRLTGIPYSFTAHGSDLHVDRHMLCRKVDEAAFVVSISEFNRRVITDECGDPGRDKLPVIHTGVDIEHFRPSVDASTDHPFSVVCVGTLHEVKGQVHLIRACARLAADGLAFVCHLVGDGPDRRMLEREVDRLGLEGRVVLAGLLDRSALSDVLRTAHVLVAPSVPTREGKREGIPVVLMEAMSSGLPVVASRLSGIPELVEDGQSGILVQPGDPAQLASALRRLADDPGLRRRLASRGRAKVEAEFDIRRNARLLAERFHRPGSHAPEAAA